jgi:hypothetical protein
MYIDTLAIVAVFFAKIEVINHLVSDLSCIAITHAPANLIVTVPYVLLRLATVRSETTLH